MNEIDRIVDQFNRAFEGDAWHGPSLLSLLSGITAAQAAARPIPSAHSIWEIVLHIAAWERGCKLRLQGKPAQLPHEEDWPPVIDASEASWKQVNEQLISAHRELLLVVTGIDENRLDKPIIDDPEIKFSSTYVTLHGCVQHDLYHAGQIAILKKTFER